MRPHPIAASIAAAVARRDPRELAAALTETVRLRALLPGAAIVAHGRADVAGCLHGWFADFDTVQLVESAGEAVADRLGGSTRRTACRPAPPAKKPGSCGCCAGP